MALALTEAEIRELLRGADLAGEMERALAAFSSGKVNQPVRTALEIGPERAYFGIMPAYLGAPAAAGAKLVTVFAANAAKGLPTHHATDSRSGALAEAGDIIQGICEGLFTEAHVAGELGEVILGSAPGRRAAEEIVIFKSLGMAVEDVAAAQFVYTRAQQQGKGRKILL